MKQQINVFVIIRICIGLLLIFSGAEKLIGPYQNFLYVVENYDFLSAPLENLVARILPWVELFIGVFLFLGLWLNYSLPASFLLFLMFICVVAQALIRNLPIVECGCFGELISFPLHVILIFDSLLLITTSLLIKKFDQTKQCSLDQKLP